MPIGIGNEKLPGSVGSHSPIVICNAKFLKMPFPRIQIVHSKRVMISPVMREHRFAPISDDMQFLNGAESKPSTWKSEGRTWERFKIEHRAVEHATGLDIFHVDGHVVQLVYLHVTAIRPNRCFSQRHASNR